MATPFFSVEPPQDDSWAPASDVWQVPLFDYFASTPISACSVEPVPAVTDPQALAFESNVGSDAVVNTQGLTTATARALTSFERMVKAVGGSFRVTSAWRPASYQQHLQAVWDKWMLELRNNHDPACQDLRSEVAQEFTRHQLLDKQRPVPVSDHTLGIGFDAAVILPFRAHRHRRRITADALARLVNLRRPDIMHDPVHFRCGARA